MNQGERDAILKRYENITPGFLNTQFSEKRSKTEAVENYNKRKQESTLYPPGELSEETDIFNYFLKGILGCTVNILFTGGVRTQNLITLFL